MRHTNRFCYEDESWEYVYLDAEPRLNEETIEMILWNSIDIYKKGRNTRELKNPDFEGKLYLKRKASFGSFAGTYLRAEGDDKIGKINLAILLLTNHDPSLN